MRTKFMTLLGEMDKWLPVNSALRPGEIIFIFQLQQAVCLTSAVLSFLLEYDHTNAHV